MEPKNCPVCNNPPEVKETRAWVYVFCPRCRMRGPQFLTRAFATRLWNELHYVDSQKEAS